MTKWIAKINENDELFGEEILLGITGGETGFEIILSNGDDSDVEDLVRRHVRIFAFVLKDCQSCEKTERNENAVPMNIQSADLKCDAVHDYGSVC